MVGWGCILLIAEIDDCEDDTYTRACLGAESLVSENEVLSPSDQAASDACDAAERDFAECWDKIRPGIFFLVFVWLVSWIAAVVPLFMMCLCTENPHEMSMGTAPNHLQMAAMPPAGSVYAPSQANQNPFAQGTQAPGIDSDAGLMYGQKSVEDDIPMYTAVVEQQNLPQESSVRLEAS